MNIRAATFASLLAICGGWAWAGTITVNDAGDAGPGNCTSTCTLRDAITAVAPGGSITFAIAPLPATIQLVNGPGFGELMTNKSLTITGPGAARLVIAGRYPNRVLDLTSGSVTITGVTIQGGFVTSPSSPGANAFGGCVYISTGSTLTLNGVDVRDCSAQATDGYPGAGISVSGGPGGHGRGGAIYVAGTLNFFSSDAINSTASGGGGGTGSDGDPSGGGSGGDGGAGGTAAGGGIYVDASGALRIENSTLAANSAIAGRGGDAGSDSMGISYGNPGNGGDASGALLGVGLGAGSVRIEFATLANGSLLVGQGGSAGSQVGTDGTPHASGMFAGSSIIALSSAVVGVQQATIALCEGSVATASGSNNLDEDASCGFPLHDTFANLFRPLDLALPWPAYMPVWHSTLIDAAASCNDLVPAPVTKDQHGTHRPQGTKCDIGAIEADYIFVDGFE